MNTVMSHMFHKFWLKITAIVVGSFGPIFFLGTMVSTMEPARLTLDILSFPLVLLWQVGLQAAYRLTPSRR
jgi:hypothetical protein